VAIANGKIWSYNPRNTQDAVKLLRERMERHKDKCFPKHLPTKLTMVFYRRKSRWLPRRERLPFRKPDLDNFLKLALDAMNGILVADDAQITSIIVKKRWAKDGVGRINIKLEEDRDGQS
jgi:Holliday junction resolvase RusA-like endonuclease